MWCGNFRISLLYPISLLSSSSSVRFLLFSQSDSLSFSFSLSFSLSHTRLGKLGSDCQEVDAGFGTTSNTSTTTTTSPSSSFLLSLFVLVVGGLVGKNRKGR